MNYYMNTSAVYDESEIGRQLYQEIGLIEEQHVTQYGSLIDPNTTMLECLLMHQYTECYSYYSCYEAETDEYIKKVWERHFEEELSHLHKAVELLQKYENKEWQQVIPNGEFPELVRLHENKEYVRNVLNSSVQLTSHNEDYVDVSKLDDNDRFFKFQDKLNTPVEGVPTHKVIVDYISKKGQDYRYTDSESPVAELRDRKSDNTTLGRKKN